MKQITLSNDTVKSRISDMSQDILDEVVAEVKASPYFALQLDKSADVSSCAQLDESTELIFVHYLKDYEGGVFVL